MAEIGKVISDLELVKASIEWDSPLDYQIMIDEAIQTIRELQEKLELPQNYQIGFQDGWVRALESSEKSEEVCEWITTECLFDYDDGLYKPSCNDDEDDFRDWNWIRHFEYCPYCGKKIKVVE